MFNNRLEVRLFRLDEIDQLQSAIHNLWAKNHILSRDLPLLKHMFYENPKHDEVFGNQNLSFLGAWYQGEIIGLLGLILSEVNVKGKNKIGLSLTNWIVSTEYRHTGAGLLLIREMLNYQPSLVLSLGINHVVSRIYSMMENYQIHNEVPRWIGLINKKDTCNLLLNKNMEFIRYYNEIEQVNNSDNNYKLNEGIDYEKWDAFYNEEFSKKYIGFSRNSSFIRWRYLNHPTFNYHLIGCFDLQNNYKGLIVYRIEKILDGQAKIGRIVEFIASDQDSAICLANYLVEIGGGNDLLFYDFYCYSSISSWGLEAVGFKRDYKNTNDNIVLPTRFQPIDLNVTDMMAAMYIGRDIQKDINLVTDQQWYITKSDADQDRPN